MAPAPLSPCAQAEVDRLFRLVELRWPGPDSLFRVYRPVDELERFAADRT